MMYPGQAMMPAGFAMAPAASPFNMAGATVTSSPPRTRLAFTLSSIKIPLPWIRAVPYQGPQEFQVHVPQPQPMPQQQPMFFTGQPGMQMMPQQPLFFTGQPQAFPSGFVPGAQFAQGFPNAQAGMVCPPCPPCPPQTPGVTPERVQKLTAQIQELEQQLKAATPAAPPVKDGK